MRLDRNTTIVLVAALAAFLGLAFWGDRLGLDAETLGGLRAGAGVLGMIALATCRSILSKDSDGDGIPDVVQRFLGLSLALALAACGAGAVQSALSLQAEIIVRAQPARFEWYDQEHERCIAGAAPRLPGERVGWYIDCMRPAEVVARSADSYRDTLHAAQAALHLGQGAEVIPCVIEAARGLMAAASSAGAPLPEDVRAIANMIPEGTCHE